MSDHISNRDNPNIVTYYQDLTDIIGIFGQFHLERIAAKNIDFAMVPIYGDNLETTRVVAFTPQFKINRWRQAGNFKTHAIISDFTDAFTRTMEASWQQFLQGLELDHVRHMLDRVRVPDRQKRFFDSYTKDLARRANSGVDTETHVNLRDDVTVGGVVSAGMNDGLEATVQLAALFGKEFKPASAVTLSKIKLDKFDIALEEIGLPPTYKRTSQETPRKYGLLDVSPLGLHKDLLRTLGLGKALGCPASAKVSAETQRYLRDKGVTLRKPTMLEEFATMMPERLNHYVGKWYAGLTPEEKQLYIDPEQNRILSGELRETVLGRAPGCPYGKEK